MANLFNFELRTRGDNVDLALVCISCGDHLCDAQAGDPIQSLVGVCEDHAASTGHGR